MKTIMHLGLPKTASTTLQNIYLSQLREPAFFAGKSTEPAISSPLYESVRDSIHSGAGPNVSDEDRRRFNSELAKVRARYRKLVISDEMLLVDTHRNSWQQKLTRLATLLDDQELELVLVIREPIVGAYSLFVELWQILSPELKDLRTFLLKSNQAKVFDYSYLYDVLLENFPRATIRFFEFRELISETGFWDLLDSLGLASNYSDDLNRLNVKDQTDKGYVSNATDLRAIFVRNRMIAAIIKRIPRRYYKLISTALSHVRVEQGHEVRYPTDEIVREFYNSIGVGLGKFEERTAIKFGRRFVHGN